MEIDTSRPQSARIWNYWLGGKDNYAADRAAGDDVIARMPDIVDGARAERAFLVRAVRFLVGEGVRQFLDVGTGLPTMNNTHEVAQSIAPECRVVYVDNDPIVMVHARALLSSTSEGATHYVQADLRDSDTVLAEAAKTLDFRQPVALMLLGVVNHVMDSEEASSVVGKLVTALPPGSFLVLTHSTAEIHGEPMRQAMREITESGGTPVTARNPDEIRAYFKGTELVEPGVVSCSHWHVEGDGTDLPKEVYLFGGVGRVSESRADVGGLGG